MQSQLPNSMITNGNDFQYVLSMPNIHDAVNVELSVIVFLSAEIYIFFYYVDSDVSVNSGNEPSEIKQMKALEMLTAAFRYMSS